MRTPSLARLVWILAAVVAAYALVNVLVFFTTGTFGTAWFVLSLLVYGSVALAAAALAFADKEKPADAAVEEAAPEPEAPAGRTVQAEVDVEASAERALRAFLDVDAMRAWWQAARGRVEARPGGVWMVAWGPETGAFEQVLTGYVEDLEPWKRLRVGNVMRLDPRQSALGPTAFEVEVVSAARGARVRFRESGFGDGPEWDAAYQAALAAWPELLQDLKRHLEAPAADARAVPVRAADERAAPGPGPVA